MPSYKDPKTGKWFCKFYYTDWTGAYKQKKKRGFQLKREADDYEREFLTNMVKSPDITFATLCEDYIRDIKINLREDTYEGRVGTIKSKYLPYFKDKKVSEITPADIRQWQNEIKKIRKPDGEPYKPTYLRTLNTQLSTIFNYAVRYYNLSKNPCHGTKSIGKKKADIMQIWTIEEFNKVIQFVDAPGKLLALKILFWTGLRIGECLALHVEDILPDKKIKVNKTHHRRDGEDLHGPPKTDNSYRTVPIPDFLYADINDYISRLYGIEPTDRILYFTKSTLNKELLQAAATAGVEAIRIHDLRHSHASMLIEMGCSIPLIAERLGDTQEEVMRTYAHLYPNKHEEVAEKMNTLENGF